MALFHAINRMAGDHWLLDWVARAFVGDYFVPVVLSLSLLALWFAAKTAYRRERQQRAVIAGAIAVAIANMAVVILNGTEWALRPRPFDIDPHAARSAVALFYAPPDPSFPSNSMAVGFALAVSIVRVNRPFGIAMGLIATLMGVSRVYAGVHFPVDIVAGAAIGSLASLLAITLLRFMEPVTAGILRLAQRLYIA
ncbi:MAG: phosphatase PAP2 family protein [Dehalococcoidia bacterium]|jgi:undecaprenyl-diphosphatase|nr:phosphatase PAP2 family protein [Dehalococcoidia bacterium]